ncbi:MAG: general secretion pathway protein [Alcaligenaceae bacterium]|nr:general secretion pathway protein [Alcaligenaceae bacterium]
MNRIFNRRGPRSGGRAAPRNASSFWQDWQLALDAWHFNQGRRAYYDYLGALLRGAAGARTLKQIFAADARRYGTGTPRGRLSHRWLNLFQAAGGDLYATWFGVFPATELAVLRNAQEQGNETLIDTLGELSRVLGVLESARAILRASLLTAVLALMVMVTTLLAVPWFTVPRLRGSFEVIPPEYYGSAIRSLFELSSVVERAWPLALPGLALALWLVLLSFGKYVGHFRRFMDVLGPWRVYRQVQALRFLALLAVALGRGDHGATRLRMALSVQSAGATPWLSAHVESMLGHVDSGRTGAAVFDTGLLDPPQLWFLDDMIAAGGLVEGLRQCSAWVERHVLRTVARQAGVMRWCLLLSAVAVVLSVALWHYAAIDDLRRGLALFHASQ